MRGSHNRRRRSSAGVSTTRVWRIFAATRCKLTTEIVRRVASIRVGDVTDILKQESTSRAIAGLGVYEFRRQLEYKAAEAGAEIIVAERPFPSARLCKRLRRSGPKFSKA